MEQDSEGKCSYSRAINHHTDIKPSSQFLGSWIIPLTKVIVSLCHDTGIPPTTSFAIFSLFLVPSIDAPLTVGLFELIPYHSLLN